MRVREFRSGSPIGLARHVAHPGLYPAIAAVTATGAAALSTLAASGGGSLAMSAAGAASLVSLAGAGLGGFTAPSTGAAALAALTAAGSGGFLATSTGAAALSSYVAAGTAGSGIFGSGAAAFSALTAAGLGQFAAGGTGAASLLSLVTAGSGVSAPWYDTAWLYRELVTIDNTANTTSALSYYQLGVSLTGTAYTSFLAHAKSDGSDIRVTDSDGVTLLNFALEGIDTANSAVYLLVKVPYCPAAAATKTIYIYYGNASATSVSSYATTVGPTTAIVGPTDEYTQSDTAGFNADPVAVLLKNQGGVHGGGAGLNGKILCFVMAGSVSNGDRTNSGIGTLSSTDGGVTWGGKSILVAHSGTNCAEPRSVVELADGTILLVYSTDTFANASAGKAKIYVAKSTDGGSTWSNLSLAPSNQLAVPWTYGTNPGGPYGRVIEKTTGGDLFLAAYGVLTGDSNSHAWLLKCPSGSDPTNGSNWVTQGTIAFDNTNHFAEPSVIQTTDASHFLAILRNDTVGDLYSCTSADSGATWTAPAVLGLPGIVVNAIGAAVSPELLKLASGNLLLCWGVRYGSDYGAVAAAVSTDGGATWLDRAPFVTTTGNNSTLWDGGYPTAVQNANGTICVLAYRNLGSLALCNVFRMIVTEDFICNVNNIYEGCESFDSLFSAHGANATISATHVHNGSNAVKIDNSAGTGGINDYVVISAWSTNTAKQTARVAYSYWGYETANDTARASRVNASATLGVGNRANEAVFPDTHLKWFNGTAYQDTGVLVPQNRWNKHTLKADVEAATVTGQLLINDASATTGLGQYATGSSPLTIQIQGGSVAATHNVIFWIDDLYTHQYTANTPTVTIGAEQAGPGSAASTGVGAASLSALVVAGSGAFSTSASGAASLASLVAAASGSFTATSAGAAALSALVAAGTAGSGVFGAGAAALASLTAVGAGAFTTAGSGAATLGSLALVGGGFSGVMGTGSAVLASLTASGAGAFGTTGFGVGTLAGLSAIGSGTAIGGTTDLAIYPDPFGGSIVAAVDPFGVKVNLKGS